jgi:hypothetical protein
MYHLYRAAPKRADGLGQDVVFETIAVTAATDRGMQIMGAGMFILAMFARWA